jgi:uncharacterized membrane protein YedE/YeeE
MQLISGLITGILFGILLQKTQIVRYEKQIGLLRLLDLTILKFVFSSIIVAMVGIYLLYDLGIVKLSIKPTNVGGNIVGGLIFGVGWALLGYCPGTSAGALGEGRWDAIFGILGMLVGAAIFAEVYPFLKKTILTLGDYGKLTMPQIVGINHWFIIPILILSLLIFFLWIERKYSRVENRHSDP